MPPRSMRVAFLAPMDHHREQFYGQFCDVMRAAAEQLGIDLEIVEATHDRAALIARGCELAARTPRPDVLLFPNYLGIAVELLPVLGRVNIRSMLVVEGLTPSERIMVGTELRGTILGEVVPDDIEGGRLLADLLVTEARRRGLAGPDDKVHIGILAGVQSTVANQRFRGWTAFREASPTVVQSGFRYGGFNVAEATTATTMLLASSPATKAIWCFNDTMSLGAVNATAALGLGAKVRPVIGGIDLLDEGLAAVEDDRMFVSLGGHFIDGARALLLLHDDQEKNELRGGVRTTRLQAVTSSRAARYRKFVRDRSWRDVDFGQFSARRNPRADRPELTLDALLNG